MKSKKKKKEKSVFERMPMDYYRRHSLTLIPKGKHFKNEVHQTVTVVMWLLLVECLRDFRIPIRTIKKMRSFKKSFESFVIQVVANNADAYLIVYQNGNMNLTYDYPVDNSPCLIISLSWFVVEAYNTIQPKDKLYTQQLMF